jgi:hypothetical protein
MMISLLKTERVLYLVVGVSSISCLYFPLMNMYKLIIRFLGCAENQCIDVQEQ